MANSTNQTKTIKSRSTDVPVAKKLAMEANNLDSLTPAHASAMQPELTEEKL